MQYYLIITSLLSVFYPTITLLLLSCMIEMTGLDVNIK